jgi:hypothetical protein
MLDRPRNRMGHLLGPPRGDDFRRFFETYAVGPTVGVDEVVEEKLKLIAEIGQAESLRDFGGVWGVYGRYLLEGARTLGATRAEMVDLHPQEEYYRRAKELESELSVQVTTVRASFQDPALYARLKPMEVSLLYDVLLHQHDPNLVILRVAQITSRVICVAQPVLLDELFALPNGCVNLQFYPLELKEAMRCPAFWPLQPGGDLFSFGLWIWGQSVSFLTSVFYGYGWDRSRLRVFHVSDCWHYAFMHFVPRQEGHA